jgi:hypothetical protein
MARQRPRSCSAGAACHRCARQAGARTAGESGQAGRHGYVWIHGTTVVTAAVAAQCRCACTAPTAYVQHAACPAPHSARDLFRTCIVIMEAGHTEVHRLERLDE